MSKELDQAMKQAAEELEVCTPGTPEYEAAMQACERLGKLQQLGQELSQKKTEQHWNRGLKIAELALSAAGLVLGTWTVCKGFRFEETGSFTSQTMKAIFPRFAGKIGK